MKQQTTNQTQKEVMQIQMRGLLPHSVVHTALDHYMPLKGSIETCFAHDFTQVAVRPSTLVFSQENSNASCPIFSQRSPFGDPCNACPPRVQAKFKIGQPGDKYEQEADRVADQVMRVTEPQVQRKACASCNENDEEELIQAKLVAGNITPSVQRQVEEENLQTKETYGETQGAPKDVQMNINNLRGSGNPLPESERSFFEKRFGYDFSQVRVHTDAMAAKSARSLNALAYTIDNDIAFDRGQYSPDTNEGKRILAHELTHVLQQKTYKKPMKTKLSISESENVVDIGLPNSFSPTVPYIQRVCGVAAIGTHTECDDQNPVFVTGHPFFKFNGGCDNFASGEELNLRNTAATLPASGSVEVHGYASVDGNATFNENLSCARALKAQAVLTSEGISTGRSSIVKHGPTPGPTADRRSVVISSTALPGQTQPTQTVTPNQQQLGEIENSRRAAAIRTQVALMRTGGNVPSGPPGRPDPGEVMRQRARSLARVMFEWDNPNMVQIERIIRAMVTHLLGNSQEMVAGSGDPNCGNRAAYVRGFRPPIVLCPAFFSGTPEERIRTMIHEAAHLARIGSAGLGESYCVIFDCDTSCGGFDSADSWAQFVHCLSGQAPDQPTVIRGQSGGQGTQRSSGDTP